MINRKIYEKIKKWIWKEKIIILKWARQVGKTTLMKQIEQDLIKKWKQTFFIYADDLSNKKLFESVDNFIYFLDFKFDLNSGKKLYLFIDEFQYIENAWLFLKNIFDKYKTKIQIIVSGSSSLEITKNTEFLTWRNIEFYIDRINFQDFLEYKFEKEISFNLENFQEIEKFYNIFKNDLEKYFLEYLSFGGYPEIVISKTIDEKIDILDSIYKNYIQKDIIAFLKIENVQAFNNLIKILANQVWNLVNKSELANTIWISRNTLDKYLDILKWTFIFEYLPPYFTNIRKELTKMPKVFALDMWILSYILWKNLSLAQEVDLWQEVENFVFRELFYKDKLSKLYFYQTLSKAEIDFVYENFEKKLSIIVLITKDICKYENWVYFVPACMIGIVNFLDS